MIPQILTDSLDRYVNHGIRTGDFLRAVLAGDLFTAAQRADPVNKHFLAEIAEYVVFDVPFEARGSYEKVDAWLKAKKEGK